MSYAQLIAYIDGLFSDGTLSEQDYQDIINYILANGNTEDNARDLIQIRRGNVADIPILVQGELAFTLDSEELFIGGLNGNVVIPTNQNFFDKISTYYIIGDGVNDNQVEIEQAVAGGYTVVLSGEILTTSRIDLTLDGTTIKGLKGNVFKGKLSIKCKNVVLEGLNFTEGSFTEDQAVWGGADGAIISGLKVLSCTFKNITGTGLEPSARFVTQEDILIRDCYFEYCTSFGMIVNGLNAKTSPGNSDSIFKNLTIENCHAKYCGSDLFPWGVGIDICEQLDILENCNVNGCSSNYNYQSGFHMESFPQKINVNITDCSAIGNGTGTISQQICSGFSCVCEGVTLVNCYSKDNKMSEYNMHGDIVRIQKAHGTLLNCKEDEMIINWNESIAREEYAKDNLIPNGDFSLGSMFYDLLFRSYSVVKYHVPNFMRKLNGASSSIVKEEQLQSLLEGVTTRRYIHGDFVTGMFKLDSSKLYTLTLSIDSRYNVGLDTLGLILSRYDYVDYVDVSNNIVLEAISLGTVTWTHNDPEITDYSITIGSGGSIPLTTDGYYNIAVDNGALLTDGLINRVYGMSIVEV